MVKEKLSASSPNLVPLDQDFSFPSVASTVYFQRATMHSQLEFSGTRAPVYMAAVLEYLSAQMSYVHLNHFVLIVHLFINAILACFG